MPLWAAEGFCSSFDDRQTGELESRKAAWVGAGIGRYYLGGVQSLYYDVVTRNPPWEACHQPVGYGREVTKLLEPHVERGHRYKRTGRAVPINRRRLKRKHAH